MFRKIRIEAAGTAVMSRVFIDDLPVTNVLAYKVEAGLHGHGPEMTTVTLTVVGVDVEIMGEGDVTEVPA